MSQYPIDFTGDASKFIREADQVIAKLLQIDHVAGLVQTKLKLIGTDTGGITRAATKSNQLATALQSVGTMSVGAQSGLRGLAASGPGLGTASGHAGRLADSFGRMVSMAAGLGLVRKVVGEIGDAIKDARKHGESMGEDNLDKKGRLRELAAIMNEPEVTDKVVNGVFNVGLKSGMSFSQSDEFLKGLYGSIPAGIKKGNLKESQIPEVAEEAARATTRFGLDAYVGGDFAGAIAQHVNLNEQRDAKGNLMTPREAMAAQFGGGVFAANEGRGAVSSLVKQELAAAAVALSSGHLSDMAEVGGFIQAASTISKTGAFSGTKFNQADVALNRQAGGGDKFGDFLKESGVADAKGDVAKLLALKKHIDEVKPDDVDAYLFQKGLHASTERRSLVGFLANTEVVTKGIAKTREIIKDGKSQVAANEKFMATQVGRDMSSKSFLEKAEFDTGQRHAEFTIAARNAKAQLESEGAFDDAGIILGEKLRGNFGFNEFAGAPDDAKRLIMRRMAKNIEKVNPEARKQGMTETRFDDMPFADKMRYLGAFFTAPGGLMGETSTQAAIREAAEPTLPMNPKAAAAAVDRAVRGNVDASTGRLNRAPAAIQGQLPRGPAGAAAAPGHAAIDASDLKRAADTLHQAGAAILTAARASQDMMPGYDGGGYDQYRA